MKKSILVITTLLLGVLAFAQGLEGTWAGKGLPGDNPAGTDVPSTAAVSYRFTEKSFVKTVRVLMDMSVESEDKNVTMTITVTGTNKGTWTREGDVLTLTPGWLSKPKADVKVEGIPSVLASMLSGPVKKDLIKSLRETDRFRIVSLSGNELVIEEIPTEKGKIPERVTLVRK